MDEKFFIASDVPQCPECKITESVIQDSRAGEWICRRCGLVVGDRIITETQEWRSFANDDKGDNKNDPNRAGARTDSLTSDLSLSTVIADDGHFTEMARLQQSAAQSERSLLRAFETVNRVCTRLAIPNVVRDHAKEVYKRVDESKKMAGRSIEVLASVCVYIACRQAGSPRTFRELCRLVGCPRRDVTRAFLKIKNLKIYKVSGSGTRLKRYAGFKTSTLMLRFCNMLRLPNDAINAAEYIADKVDALAISGGKNPATMAGAILMLVCGLHPTESRTAVEIASVVQISDTTIKETYQKLLKEQSLDKLLPPNFATKPGALKKLSGDPAKPVATAAS